MKPYELAVKRHNNSDLYDLFEVSGHDPRDITPAQAAHALSNYLTTGKPRWDEALA